LLLKKVFFFFWCHTFALEKGFLFQKRKYYFKESDMGI